MIRLVTLNATLIIMAFKKFTFHLMIRLVTINGAIDIINYIPFTFHLMIRLVTNSIVYTSQLTSLIYISFND